MKKIIISAVLFMMVFGGPMAEMSSAITIIPGGNGDDDDMPGIIILRGPNGRYIYPGPDKDVDIRTPPVDLRGREHPRPGPLPKRNRKPPKNDEMSVVLNNLWARVNVNRGFRGLRS